MKKRLTVFIGLLFLIILVFAFQFSISKPTITTRMNTQISKIDTSDLDREELKKEMGQLKNDIKAIQKEKIKINFDSNKFKEEIKKIAVEMKKLRKEDLNLEFDFNSEEFKSNMKALTQELKDKQIVLKDFDIDMCEIHEQMKELDKELKDININLKDMDIELEKLDDYMKELKIEMKNDGLIDDKNEDISLKINNKEMILNGAHIPDDLFQKYIELYKDHFGKEPDDNLNIHIH